MFRVGLEVLLTPSVEGVFSKDFQSLMSTAKRHLQEPFFYGAVLDKLTNFQIMVDVEETLKRIQAQKNVTGVIIMDSHGTFFYSHCNHCIPCSLDQVSVLFRTESELSSHVLLELLVIGIKKLYFASDGFYAHYFFFFRFDAFLLRMALSPSSKGNTARRNCH